MAPWKSEHLVWGYYQMMVEESQESVVLYNIGIYDSLFQS